MNDFLGYSLIISFVATTYSTFCVFIPVKPFRNRFHAMKWLLVTFFTMMLISGVMTAFFDT